MKKMIALVLSGLFLTSVAVAANVVPAKELRIQVKDPSVDYSQISVRISWHCSYSAGIVWRESKSCKPKDAVSELAAVSDVNGVVKLPAIPMFKGGFRASNLKNYDVSYFVNYKNKQMFSMHARGKIEIQTLAKTKLDVMVSKIDAAEVNVTIGGSPVAGSELSKLENASISASLSVDSGDLSIEERFSIYSGTYNKVYENRKLSTSPKFSDFQKFSVPDIYIAYLVNQTLSAKFYIVVNQQNPEISSIRDMTHRFVTEVEDTPDAIRNLQTVELPPFEF
jgi:hypothetical protein